MFFDYNGQEHNHQEVGGARNLKCARASHEHEKCSSVDVLNLNLQPKFPKSKVTQTRGAPTNEREAISTGEKPSTGLITDFEQRKSRIEELLDISNQKDSHRKQHARCTDHGDTSSINSNSDGSLEQSLCDDLSEESILKFKCIRCLSKQLKRSKQTKVKHLSQNIKDNTLKVSKTEGRLEVVSPVDHRCYAAAHKVTSESKLRSKSDLSKKSYEERSNSMFRSNPQNTASQKQPSHEDKRAAEDRERGATHAHRSLYPRDGDDLSNLSDGTYTMSRTSDESTKRVFPFEATPSGKLKIAPKQVVFESKKVSILVADPTRTKVNVNTDVVDGRSQSESPSFPIPTDILRQPPPQMPANRVGPSGMGGFSDADGDFPRPQQNPMTFLMSPQNKTNKEDDMADDRRAKFAKDSFLKEIDLERMGYTNKDQIDWAEISMPVKSDVHKLLHHRISNCINPDFIVQIGKREYYCHFLVLQCYSAFFENMEKNVRSKELPESHVTGDAFQALYAWMIYPNQNSFQLLRRDNILEMFMAAQYLGVKELEEQCWAFIDNEELFSEDTAFLLYLDARRLNNGAVMELMVPRIQRFFLMLVSSKDWLDLQIEEVSVFLRSNYICIHCEMEVFMSAVRWLMFDWPKRSVFVVEVMKCIRFGQIAPWQLVDIRRNPESPEFIEITKECEVQQMVEDGLAFAIIKYWYGHDSQAYDHWIDLLGLTEPPTRNWAGAEKSYLAYRDFLADLEMFRSQQMKGENKKGVNAEESTDSSTAESTSRENISQSPVNPLSLTVPPMMRKGPGGHPLPPPPIPTMIEFMTRRGQGSLGGSGPKMNKR